MAKQAMHKTMNHYVPLAIMTGVSFIAMYVLMYSMVDRLGYVYNSVNQVWMAALMAAPMVLIELAVMGAMYPDKRLNAVLMAGSVVAAIVFFALIRYQTGIGDVQFVRSMIPHHSGAILMCREASVTDAELKKLCGEIIQGQQREIDQMQAILARLKS